MNALWTAQFVITRLQEQHGSRFTGSRRAHAPKLAVEERFRLEPLTLLRSYQLYGVRAAAQEGLISWLEGRYPLSCRADIPTCDEMLDCQCEGRRFVTVLTSDADRTRQLGRHHGALEFLLHDLEHAQKFFGNPEWAHGQRAFFNCLRRSLRFPKWNQFDAIFNAQLDYVKSDMNSHPLHMLKYLKAILLEAARRRGDPDVDRVVGDMLADWNLPSAADRINRPGFETRTDQVEVSEFFLGF